MSLLAELSELAVDAREHPVVAALELGSLAVCVALFVGTVLALASGPPVGIGRGGLWLAVVVLGAAFVVFWTVAVPLYERYGSEL